jgi:hypothetical protein
MTPAPTMHDLIETVRTDAGTDDPLVLLATASATVAKIADATDAVLGHFVDQCRLRGHSWTEISASLGVTKQAAHKRFAFDVTFERVTARAREALDESAKAAQRLGHPYVGTEHLLLGLLVDPASLAAKVLTEMGVTREAVEAAIALRTGTQVAAAGDPPLTPLAKDAVGRALREALTLGHNYIGTEHILLALLDDTEGTAAAILTSLGVTLDRVRARVIQVLSELVTARTATAPPQASAAPRRASAPRKRG